MLFQERVCVFLSGYSTRDFASFVYNFSSLPFLPTLVILVIYLENGKTVSDIKKRIDKHYGNLINKKAHLSCFDIR